MSNSELLDEIEVATKAIKQGEALERLLSKSNDFNLIIKEGYFKEYLSYLVSQRGLDETKDNDLMRAIDAIAYLQRYFDNVLFSKESAEIDIQNSKALLSEYD